MGLYKCFQSHFAYLEASNKGRCRQQQQRKLRIQFQIVTSTLKKKEKRSQRGRVFDFAQHNMAQFPEMANEHSQQLFSSTLKAADSLLMSQEKSLLPGGRLVWEAQVSDTPEKVCRGAIDDSIPPV